MIDQETTILFRTPLLPRVEASDGVVGGASGEVVGAIVGGEVPMDGEGATPPEQSTKMVLKPEDSPQWAKEPILAKRPTTTWWA